MMNPSIDPLAYALCFHCARHFERSTVRWCDCISRNRTALCPHCGLCSCQAPSAWIATYGAFTIAEPEQPQERETTGIDRRPVVLVADDDRVVRTMLCRALGGAYRVITAEDGVEALMQVYAHRPAVIVTDALMPGLDGRSVSRQVKLDPSTRHIKVVLLTAMYRERQYESEAKRDYHVDAFLRKPVRPEELRGIVSRLLPTPLRAAS